MKSAHIFLAVSCLIGLFALPAQAGGPPLRYSVTQHLSFGSFSVARNDGTYNITVAPDGSTSFDPGVYPDVAATPAEYELTNFPPNMTITIGVSVASPPSNGGLIVDNVIDLAQGGSPSFTLSNFTSNNPTTDAGGNATLLIGATLTTTGLGGYYSSGGYAGTMDLTFYVQ